MTNKTTHKPATKTSKTEKPTKTKAEKSPTSIRLDEDMVTAIETLKSRYPQFGNSEILLAAAREGLRIFLAGDKTRLYAAHAKDPLFDPVAQT